MAHDGHTLRTPLGGCIPEFTYPEGPVPSLIVGHSQASHLGNRRSTAHNELTRGKALSGHIPLGNHTVDHLRGLAPTSAFSCSSNLHPGGLGLMTHGRHTLRTPHRGCILEFTYVGGLAPSLIAGHGQDFPPRKPEDRGSWQARPRNGPRWLQPSRESGDHSNQWVNTHPRLLPSPNSTHGETRLDDQTTP